MKKAHIGSHGVTPCMRRVSLHVRHTPMWVVSLDKFLALPPEQQCRRCRARSDVAKIGGEDK